MSAPQGGDAVERLEAWLADDKLREVEKMRDGRDEFEVVLNTGIASHEGFGPSLSAAITAALDRAES